MLDNIQSELEEGNLDSASINEGLEEMAKDLQQSDKLEPTAHAMQNKQLSSPQNELRKLAEKLGLNTPESSKEMQKSLQQAAENTRPGLEELAKMLKEAAENLKNGQQEGAQQSLDGAAQELDAFQQRMDSQELKNMASKQIQNLKDSLQQRQQAGAKARPRPAQQASGKGQGAQGSKTGAGPVRPERPGTAAGRCGWRTVGSGGAGRTIRRSHAWRQRRQWSDAFRPGRRRCTA